MIGQRLPMPPSSRQRSHGRARDDRVGLVEAARILAMLDGVDDLAGNTLGDCFRLVRRPFELAIELTGSGENGQLANTQCRLVAQIAVERPGVPGELGTMQQNAAGASQTSDGPALRV